MASKLVTSDKIRNVAVVGHSSTGKTTFISAALYDTKELNRLGKVDKGTAITDFDEESVERKITIGAAIAHLMHKGHRINLVDTPGYSIFTTEAVQGIKVAEAALMMVSAVAGPEVQTEKLWKICGEMSTPVLVVLNAMDRERASASRTVEQLQKKFGRTLIPIQLPIGEEHKFSGIVDLVHRKAYRFPADETGAMEAIEIPAEMKDDVDVAYAQLVEMVAEQDEALLEKFFGEGMLSDDELSAGLAKAVAERKLSPVLLCSSGRNQAVQPILDAILDLVPNPLTRTLPAKNVAGDDVILQARPNDTPVAYVFKTISDPYAGRITIMRVFSGSLQADGTYHNRQRDLAERFGPTNLIQGKELQVIERLVCGDIGAVAKLKETRTGETLTSKDGAVMVNPVQIPEAAISFAIAAKAKGEEVKIAQGLQKLQDEDPTLKLGRDPQTKEQLVAGQGAQALQGRGDPPAAQGPLPRDRHQDRRADRPPQEAVRGSRPVRRGEDPHRAPPPRRRLRVRGQDLRRVDLEQLPAVRGQGHPGCGRARRPLRPPGRGLPRRPARRQGARRRLLRHGVQDLRPQGIP
ncbi:MAG: GTP-binding protein [Thermoanaerobaculaceae bacterium]|nr:GTP-binding protein [Thermoanaerobaculaceae bacterium]